MRKQFLAVLTAVVILSLGMAGGCSSRSGRFLAGNSYLAEEYPANALATVAEHLAETLAASYPPGYTALFLQQNGGQQDELGSAIESALRSRGFTLMPEKDDHALPLVYVLDRLDEETWYSQLAVSDGLVLTRTWRLTGDNLEMEAATIRSGQTENGHVQQ